MMAAPIPANRSLPWDLAALFQAPATHPSTQCAVPGMHACFYEGLEFKARPTWVFAYYAAPEGQPPAGGWPAVVCVHGGGGTAYPEWVKTWNRHGYAALAMDVEGHLPEGPFPNRRWHENAGPSRVMTFMDIELADREQWFYHAVADVIRGHSLLRSFPEINPDKIGLTGISWGGTIVSAVAGVDPRFAFVVPVYGCGFMHESGSEARQRWFRAMSGEQLQSYRTKWDPSVHLPFAQMPILWVNGSNDSFGELGIWQHSALTATGPRTLCLRLRMPHGHAAGWEPREIYAFADSITKGALPLPVARRPDLEAESNLARCKTQGKITKAELCYTTQDGAWPTRTWASLPCGVNPDEVSATIPQATTAFFFNVSDSRDCLTSSELIEIKVR